MSRCDAVVCQGIIVGSSASVLEDGDLDGDAAAHSAPVTAAAAASQDANGPSGGPTSFVGRDGVLLTLLGLSSEAELGDGRGLTSHAVLPVRKSVEPAKASLTPALLTGLVPLALPSGSVCRSSQ